MADIVDRKTRSRMMAGIRGKDTKPEMLLRSSLHKRGFRYRVHVAGLPGRPDLVLARYRAIIFVHGCFWHRHKGCKYATTPSSNTAFWHDKFAATIKRDQRIMKQIEKENWRLAVIWECALKTDGIENTTSRLASWLRSDRTGLELPDNPPANRTP